MPNQPKSNRRNERHGAAWGSKVPLLLILFLLVNLSAAQNFRRFFQNGSVEGRKFSPYFAQMLQQRNSNQPMRVIVQYKSAPGTADLSNAQAHGAKFHRRLPLVRGGVYTMHPKDMLDLASDPNVISVSPDFSLKAADDFTNAAVGMYAARSLGLGMGNTGIGVAVIDSGINANHDDFLNGSGQSRVVYHEDLTGTSAYNSHGQLVYDTYGHGTHVAGILAGNGADSSGQYAGISYGVNLIDLRALDGNGSGNDSSVIAAIQRAIALKSTYNIRIINLSLGRPIFGSYVNDPLCQAVEQAWNAGIVVVVAAGNYGRLSVNGSNGYGTVTAPGNDPYVLTVGGMKAMGTYDRSDDQIASYSSKGPSTFDHIVKPDIVAPGNLIRSTVDRWSTLTAQHPGNMVKGTRAYYDYFVLSGTSMATPVVSGAAALLLEQNPALTPDQVKARLMKTAYKTFPISTTATDATTGLTYTSYYDLFTVGAGYLDVAAAVANTDSVPSTVGSALSPAAVFNSSDGSVSLSYGNASIPATSVVWGTSVVWSTSVVWGTNVASNSVVWSTSVVWATSSDSAFSVVWSTSESAAESVVWSTSSELSEAQSVDADGEE